MIFVLDATNRSLKFTIDVAGADVQFTAAWADSSGAAFSEGSTQGVSNGTTAVDVVGAPGASTRRVVKTLTFYNAHASAARTVTLYYDIGGTVRNIAKFTLAAGQTWYSDTAGSGSGGGAGITDGDKGDITVSGSGATWTIDNSVISTAKIADAAVTYAKIQNVTDARLLGRSAGSAGSVQEITVGSGLSLSGGALTATGGGGGGLTLDTTFNTNSAHGNISAAVNRRYLVNMSGLTATRNFDLPVPTAVGDIIQVVISVGNDSFELVLKGVSTVTINGGSAATEWSRIFITGEAVEFVATSSTNWSVMTDGRIPCVGYGADTGAFVGTGSPAANITVSSVSGSSTEIINTSAAHSLSVNDPIWFLQSGNFSGTVNGFELNGARSGTCLVKSVGSSTTFTIKTVGGTDLTALGPLVGASIRKSSVLADNTIQKIQMRTASTNRGNVMKTSTQSIKCRRAGLYQLAMNFRTGSITGTFQAFLSPTDGSGTTAAPLVLYAAYNSYASSQRPTIATAALVALAYNDDVYAQGRQGAGVTSYFDYLAFDPYMTISEIL